MLTKLKPLFLQLFGLLMLLGSIQGQTFRIDTLTANNSTIADHNSLTGDDRGGIAVSSSHVFYTGDTSTAGFPLSNLAGGASLGVRYDALVSDLRSGKVYSFANASGVLPNGGGTATRLLEHDPASGALNGNEVSLSTPVNMSSGTGIFAGYGRVVVHSGNVYDIALPSGTVTDRGAMAEPTHVNTENWAHWGVAEFFGGTLYISYVQSSTTIARTTVPSGVTSTIATFSTLSDMATISVSPTLDRWYFHHEGGSQFGGSSETIGFADATFLLGADTLAVSAGSETGATLNGVVNPDGLSTTAWFEWGTSPTLVGAASTPAVSVGNGLVDVPISHALSGLTPNTSYYFRAVRNNSSGTERGDILSFHTGPEIVIEQADGTVLVDAGPSIGLNGAVGLATPPITFTIKNRGVLPLSGLAVAVDGTDAAEFTVSALGTTTLAAGASTTFDVTFTAGEGGARSATLRISSNDPDENPFDIALSGTGIFAVPPVGGSDLLTTLDVFQIQEWLGEAGALTLTKVFSAEPGDGKTASDFHTAVDGIGRTISIIELPAQGAYPRKVIGGYNPQSWNSSSSYNYTYTDPERTAFIFNLTTGLLHRQKLVGDPSGSLGQYQTFNRSTYGPTFGGGHDIQMASTLRSGYTRNHSYGTTTSVSYIDSIADGGQGSGLSYGRLEVFTLSVSLEPAVSTSEMTGVSFTTATAGGTVLAPGESAVTERGIVFSTTPTPTVEAATKVISGSGVGSFTAELTGLTPATTYYVRAYATNGVGTAYGAEQSFSALFDAPPTFENTPLEWAVIGGEYEFLAETLNTGTPPVTMTAIQKPTWLTLDGTRLYGTPPNEDEGLNPLIFLRATNGDGRTTDLSFRVEIGRLVGPVAAPPGGATIQWVDGMPQLARTAGSSGTGGDTLLVTGATRSDEFPIFWGLTGDGFGMAMDYSGPDGSGGDDFPVPEMFTFDPAEIGQWSEDAPTDLASGIGVWMGTTNRPASIGGASVETYLRADARNLADTAGVPFIHADVVGLSSMVGALAQIPAAGDMRVGLRLNAEGAYPSGTPALDWFNSLSGKLTTDRTITSIDYAFYWLNTVPRFTANTGLAVDQGDAVVITTSMLNAEDTEDTSADIRFALGDGSSAGTPQNGSVEVFDGSSWNALPGGGSFTLEEVENGEVRYQHDDSYTTSDGFNYRILDAQDAVARDGNFTVFQTGVTITLINHPPVANNQSIDVGIGATVSGVLSFSDADIGFIPQTINVTSAATPTNGSFTITDAATGAFTFVSNGSTGSEDISWSVSDGELSDSGTLTVNIANQLPTIQPFSLSGSNAGNITGTVVVNDPDLPAQSISLQVITPPTKGSLQITGLGVSYTPDAGRFGDDEFTITATDALSGVSTEETVSISIRPATFGTEALFVGGNLPILGGGQEGLIQRVNPENGDVYTLATNLGREVRGLAWSESLGMLLASVSVQDSGSPLNALVKVNPLSGSWSFGSIFASDGNIVFPLGITNDGPDHVLLANGPGGVVRVEIATGTQEVLDLGLPAGAFVVSAIPVGADEIWVSSIADLGTANDGNLFLGNRTTNTATTPVSLSPAGDPAGMFLDASNTIAIARTGIPVETIGLSPLSYTAHGGSPTAPWSLPTAVTEYGNAWITADPFGSALYTQTKGTTVATVVSAPGLASPFGLLTVAGAPNLTVEVIGEPNLESGDTYDIGSAAVDGGWIEYLFVLNNRGTNNLSLSPPTISGGDVADFSIITGSSGGTVATGSATNLVIRFDPSALGIRSTTVTIDSDDPDEPSFSWTLVGHGNSPPNFTGYAFSTDENSSASVSFAKLLTGVTDPEGHSFSVSGVDTTSSLGGSVSMTATAIVYTPPVDTNGADSFSVTVTDEIGASVTATVNVTIRPEAGSDDTLTRNPVDLNMNESDEAELAFRGIPGRSYRIQRSIDLSDWSDIATVTASQNGEVTFTDTDPPSPNAFYRIASN